MQHQEVLATAVSALTLVDSCHGLAAAAAAADVLQNPDCPELADELLDIFATDLPSPAGADDLASPPLYCILDSWQLRSLADRHCVEEQQWIDPDICSSLPGPCPSGGLQLNSPTGAAPWHAHAAADSPTPESDPEESDSDFEGFDEWDDAPAPAPALPLNSASQPASPVALSPFAGGPTCSALSATLPLKQLRVAGLMEPDTARSRSSSSCVTGQGPSRRIIDLAVETGISPGPSPRWRCNSYCAPGAAPAAQSHADSGAMGQAEGGVEVEVRHSATPRTARLSRLASEDRPSMASRALQHLLLRRAELAALGEL
ncbi:hypothetical protein V8C86DRAFT_2452565 [Haematococcus lacustris]